jgi:hypothetical protein
VHLPIHFQKRERQTVAAAEAVPPDAVVAVEVAAEAVPPMQREHRRQKGR